MDVAYDNAAWQTFFAALAGATAALMGLLFVALSLHLHVIVSNPSIRGRAHEAHRGFLSLLALAILALIPGQSSHLLGGEIIMVGLAIVGVSIRLQRGVIRGLTSAERRSRLALPASINVGTASILVAGISLLLGRGGGLFWLVPTFLLYLGNALFNAWALTVEIGER